MSLPLSASEGKIMLLNITLLAKTLIKKIKFARPYTIFICAPGNFKEWRAGRRGGVIKKICLEHSIHGYHLRRFGVTKHILLFNVIFFYIICQDQKITVIAVAAPRPTFFWTVILRLWPLADVLAINNWSWCNECNAKKPQPSPNYGFWKNFKITSFGNFGQKRYFFLVFSWFFQKLYFAKHQGRFLVHRTNFLFFHQKGVTLMIHGG